MIEEIEIWKPIIGFEKKYEISNLGRVKSLNYRKTKKEQILKPRITRGYLYVCFGYRGKNYYIHHLVLDNFVGCRPTTRHEAAHLDGVKSNNRQSNLLWKTHEENEHDKVIHQTKVLGQAQWKSILTEEDVVFIRNNYQKGRRGISSSFSLTGLANKFNVKPMTIFDVIKRNTWKHV